MVSKLLKENDPKGEPGTIPKGVEPSFNHLDCAFAPIVNNTMTEKTEIIRMLTKENLEINANRFFITTSPSNTEM